MKCASRYLLTIIPVTINVLYLKISQNWFSMSKAKKKTFFTLIGKFCHGPLGAKCQERLLLRQITLVVPKCTTVLVVKEGGLGQRMQHSG